jgi:hypothetical protein
MEIERFDRLCAKAQGLAGKGLINLFVNSFENTSDVGEYSAMMLDDLTYRGRSELVKHS